MLADKGISQRLKRKPLAINESKLQQRLMYGLYD